MSFRLDTGADVSVVPEHLLSKLQDQGSLRHADKVLLGPTKERLHVLGVLQATVTFKDSQTTDAFYVTRNVNEPLLGLDLIEAPKHHPTSKSAVDFSSSRSNQGVPLAF